MGIKIVCAVALALHVCLASAQDPPPPTFVVGVNAVQLVTLTADGKLIIAGDNDTAKFVNADTAVLELSDRIRTERAAQAACARAAGSVPVSPRVSTDTTILKLADAEPVLRALITELAAVRGARERCETVTHVTPSH